MAMMRNDTTRNPSMHSIRALKTVWCLLLLLPVTVNSFNLNIAGLGGNVGGFDNVRFDFQFGLPEGVAVGQDDIEALLCRTQDYLSEVVYQEFPDHQLEVKATGIVWEVDKEDPLPVRVSFTAALSGINGTIVPEMPSPEELKAATEGLDMGSYLTNIVQTAVCPTRFSRATKAEYKTQMTPDIRGDFSEVFCQSTCAPTFTPGVPTSKRYQVSPASVCSAFFVAF